MPKTLKEVHKLAPISDAIELNPDARYLVVIHGPVTHNRIEPEDCSIFKEALAAIGIKAVVCTGAEFSVYQMEQEEVLPLA